VTTELFNDVPPLFNEDRVREVTHAARSEDPLTVGPSMVVRPVPMKRPQPIKTIKEWFRR
jgi:hypothetical protein